MTQKSNAIMTRTAMTPTQTPALKMPPITRHPFKESARGTRANGRERRGDISFIRVVLQMACRYEVLQLRAGFAVSPRHTLSESLVAAHRRRP
jgi:hypothetical protein